jgi:hypothetical protein
LAAGDVVVAQKSEGVVKDGTKVKALASPSPVPSPTGT